MAGLLMFPVMLLGPSCAGIYMIGRTSGSEGLRDLRRRMARLRAPGFCYAVLLVPPILIWSVLTVLSRTVSPDFTPNHFWIGAAFGIFAGFLEEIGWVGFALPRFLERHSVFTSGAMLGVLWGLWHLPVIDFLGTATPHGRAWLPYCAAFILAMTGIRILIAYQYRASKSVALAQLLHMSSTGSLVVFSAPKVSGMQEASWYMVYAAALWIVAVAVAVGKRGR
jgi:membrane protease YdiL (CAAX protease family)